MAFRLIKNRAQQIAVIGFAATTAICVVLSLTKTLAIDITLPFTMVWIMIWLLASITNSKRSE